MRKKYSKLAISVLMAFGLFINFSTNIHADINNPIKTISISADEPIGGSH